MPLAQQTEYSSRFPVADDLPAVPRIVVIGCSGHARVILDILEEQRAGLVVGFLDTFKPRGTEVMGYQVLGRDEDLPQLVTDGVCDSVIVAIGDNWVRSRMVERVAELAPGISFATAIHPSAQISRTAIIGQGTVIMPGVVVNNGSRIGSFCILNTAATLDHDCQMEKFSSLAPRAVTGGNVSIGAFSAVAIGAVVSHGIRIGEHAVIGAGATVIRHVPDRVVAYGTPARTVRTRQPGDPYLLEPPAAGTSRVRSSPAASSSGSCRPSLRLVAATNPVWHEYIDRTKCDFFHSAEYHQLSDNFGSGTAWLAVYGTADKFVAWPYLLRDIETNGGAIKLRDITSVYGYAGPLTHQCEGDESFLEAAWSAMVEEWAASSVVSVFTRFHPILNNVRNVTAKLTTRHPLDSRGGPLAQGRNVAIDLIQSHAEIWNGYKRNVRSALRRGEEMGLTTSADPDWNYLEDFVRLYHDTMKRNQAVAFYFFSMEYFRELKRALGDHGCLIVTQYQGVVIGAALLIEFRGVVNVHLLATDDRFGHLSPSKVVIHEAQRWARERGNRLLHLGGGRGSRNDDSLYRFKALFSDLWYPFFTGRWVLNQEAYDSLTLERNQRHEQHLTPAAASAYFPAYRAPLPEVVNRGQSIYQDPTTDEVQHISTAN